MKSFSDIVRIESFVGFSNHALPAIFFFNNNNERN